MRKICNKCNTEKDISEYHKDKNKKDGYRHTCKICVRQYQKDNASRILEIQREWSAKNRDRIRAREDNDKRRQQKKDAVKRLKERDPDYFKRWWKQKRDSDPNFRMTMNLRGRISELLKGKCRSKKSEELLGCSFSYFEKYIHDRFLPTMTWENYGMVWHIDHIIPCSTFDLSREEDQLKCFHYTNLQPLFAVTTIIDGVEYLGNLNKNAKIL